MKNIIIKKGSIEILFMCAISIFIILIFSIVFILYSQINICVYRVKQDIYNIVQNVILSFDKEELAYNNYYINEKEMSEKVNKIISLNYSNVKLKYLNYDKEENEVSIVVTIIVKPIGFISKKEINVREKVKIKLMELDFDENAS